MKKTVFTALLFASLACRDAAGPSGGGSPGGTAVVWFNGLSSTIDAWYPESDSIIHGAWLSGAAPNQIKAIGNHRFAVLSSLDAELLTASADEPGEYLLCVPLPSGTNPYCFSVNGEIAWISLLLADSVVKVSLAEGSMNGGFPTRSNPSGIACTDSLVFVSYANWPEQSSPGGVSVYHGNTYAETAWLDTGANTHWLSLQPTGLVHCYSTTYKNDGRICIIDPSGEPSVVSTVNCGGAPGEAVYHDGKFVSPDGWGQEGLVVYRETGAWERVSLNFTPTGLAVLENLLYATCFGKNMIYILDPDDFAVLDSIPSGGEGPQGIIAVRPAT